MTVAIFTPGWWRDAPKPADAGVIAYMAWNERRANLKAQYARGYDPRNHAPRPAPKGTA